MYLRSQMDAQGWVSLSLLMTFNKVRACVLIRAAAAAVALFPPRFFFFSFVLQLKSLTTDVNFVLEALSKSTEVEVITTCRVNTCLDFHDVRY